MIIHETEVGEDENHENSEIRNTMILRITTVTYLFVFINYSVMVSLSPQKT